MKNIKSNGNFLPVMCVIGFCVASWLVIISVFFVL
jgi:hypothetical protein